MSWGYESALEATGAKVIAFGSFGSYEGEWWAKVEFNGEVGWTTGYYGSCSGCDAFEEEFGWDDPTQDQLSNFGLRYLDELYSQEQAEKEASRNLDWDVDAREMLDFIKQHA